jgi:hypothetical protein
MKLIEHFNQTTLKEDWRTLYRRYRLGRLKHEYWLKNRKSKNKVYIDEYDYKILLNCQPGHTLFFSSAGYYLKDIFPEITVVEQFDVVKTFYSDVIICKEREQLKDFIDTKVDNFAMVNNRSEMWTTVDGLTDHFNNYIKIMNSGCRVFYSFRDTQMYVNRLTVNLYNHYLDWAKSLENTLGLQLVWYDIQFPLKEPDPLGNYNLLENPDTTNGNLKFWFVYKGTPWEINHA